MKVRHTFWMAAAFILGVINGYSQDAKAISMPIATTSQQALATFKQGLALTDIGDYKKARVFFEKAVHQDANLAIGYTYLALTSVTPKDFADNLSKAKANLAHASEWEKLHYNLVETYLTNDADKRLLVAQQMVERFPDAARSYFELGNAYQDRQDFARARENFQKATFLAPSWPTGYEALAGSYLFGEPKDLKVAETNAQKVASLAPKSAAVHVLLGDCYRAQSHLEKAREAYAKAIELDPTAPNAYYKRGHANTLLGSFDRARSDYQQAGKFDDLPAAGHQYIAFTYLYQGEPTKALQWLMDQETRVGPVGNASKTVALKFTLLEPAPMIAFHMGAADKLNDVLKRFIPVLQHYYEDMGTEESQLLQKSILFYWQGLSNVLQGNYEAAKQMADSMSNVIAPINDPRKQEGYHRLMGQIHYRQNNFEQAINEFKQTDRTNVYDRYWLAKTYETAGQKDKAKELYMDIADYNFNEIGYALIRKEVKKKLDQQ